MKKDKIERIIIIYVWIYAIIVASIIYLIDQRPVLPVSFLLGVCTNLLCFTMTVKMVDRVIKYDDLRTRNEFIKNNVKKMLVYLVILLAAGFSQKFQAEKTLHLNIIATACGFFSVKIMIYFKEFILDKIFRHKEENNSQVKTETKVYDDNEEDEIINNKFLDILNKEKEESRNKEEQKDGDDIDASNS